MRDKIKHGPAGDYCDRRTDFKSCSTLPSEKIIYKQIGFDVKLILSLI